MRMTSKTAKMVLKYSYCESIKLRTEMLETTKKTSLKFKRTFRNRGVSSYVHWKLSFQMAVVFYK